MISKPGAFQDAGAMSKSKADTGRARRRVGTGQLAVKCIIGAMGFNSTMISRPIRISFVLNMLCGKMQDSGGIAFTGLAH